MGYGRKRRTLDDMIQKVLGWGLYILVSLLCLCISLLPEIAMYFLWQLVNPQDELMRVALVALFFFAGGGMCILFGFLGFAAWISITAALI